MLAPIWVNFLSVCIFKEKFELKYILGCFICLFGTYLICLGEKGGESKDIISTIFGVFFSLCCSISIAGATISSKILLKTYNSYELIYLIGFYTSLICFVLCFIQYDTLYDNISFNFLLLAFFNGVFNFCANHFSFRSYELADLNKISYINYIQIIFSLISGFLVFNENLHFLDFIGGFIIFFNSCIKLSKSIRTNYTYDSSETVFI